MGPTNYYVSTECHSEAQKLIMSSPNVIVGPKGRVMTFLTKAIQRWRNLSIGFGGGGISQVKRVVWCVLKIGNRVVRFPNSLGCDKRVGEPD